MTHKNKSPQKRYTAYWLDSLTKKVEIYENDDYTTIVNASIALLHFETSSRSSIFLI